MTPTQRSLKLLRERGYMAEVTERWNPYARVRHDLFSFIDILAVRGNETIGVQVTTATNMAARIAKINGLQSADLWHCQPYRTIVIHGWKRPTKTRRTWEVKELAL